eukprot:8296739-Prorocentrum_lima.AAC.1
MQAGCIHWREFGFETKKLGVMTACSGTEAPIEAMKLLFGRNADSCIRHIISVEIDKVAREFILHHHPPEVLLTDVASLEDPKVYDDPDFQTYSKHADEIDICMGGFPCKAFSTINPNRYTSEEPRFDQKEAQ